MALKDIFTMIKADRYTADGCEEIKKAQDAIKEETEDAGLPDGTQRQRKDGLYVKQGGKWVPAPAAKGAKKNGPDMNAEKAKHAEARKDRESAGAKQDLPADLQKQAQEYVAWEKPEVIQRYINNLRKPFSIERDSFKEPDKLAEALEIELKKKTESKPAQSTPNLSKEDKIRMLSNSKHRSFSSVPVSEWKETYSKLSDKELDEAYEDFLKFRNPDDYKAGGKFDYAGRTGDSAPRELTGDCKIRIRK